MAPARARTPAPGSPAPRPRVRPRPPASPATWPLRHQPGLYSSRAARPGPSAPHPLSATSERGRGAPPAPARRPLPARLLRITCLGVLRSGPGRCRSVARPLAPSSRLPSSSPLSRSRCQSRRSWGEWPAASGSSKYRQAEGEREGEGGREESQAPRVGSANKGERRGEGNGGKEGQMGRGRKEREMRKAEGGRL